RRIDEPEQARGRLVHARVGGLRREDHGDEQREEILMLEFPLWMWIGGGEALEDRLDASGFADFADRPPARGRHDACSALFAAKAASASSRRRASWRLT